jgi:hypothetical protein
MVFRRLGGRLINKVSQDLLQHFEEQVRQLAVGGTILTIREPGGGLQIVALRDPTAFLPCLSRRTFIINWDAAKEAPK